MARLIEAETLQSKKTVILARWLLGKFLVRRLPDGSEDARMILETEAYCGERDLACHARAGRTKRTEVMYGDGGVWYVYLCYGIHEMLNLVVGPRDWPAAILIRGVEGAIGPGRVTKALRIDRQLNAKAAAPSSGLWLEDRGTRLPRGAVKVTPRIGIDYAGPIWSKKHWRFTFHPPAPRSPHAVRLKPQSTPASRPSVTRARATLEASTSRDR
jgi:DNA-3-methyladenine glycosylase